METLKFQKQKNDQGEVCYILSDQDNNPVYQLTPISEKDSFPAKQGMVSRLIDFRIPSGMTEFFLDWRGTPCSLGGFLYFAEPASYRISQNSLPSTFSFIGSSDQSFIITSYFSYNRSPSFPRPLVYEPVGEIKKYGTVIGFCLENGGEFSLIPQSKKLVK